MRDEGGLAIASVVTGVLAFIPLLFRVTPFISLLGVLAGIAGIILGIVSLNIGRGRRGLAIAGIVLSLGACFLNAETPHHPGRELARRARCAMNLKSLSRAIQAYQADNKDLYPADLNSTVKEMNLPPELLQCPTVAGRGRACDYFYTPPAKDAPSNAVIACDLAGNHDDYRNILYASGALGNMKEAAFQQLMAKPENTEFVSKLRQAESPSAK